MDPNPDGRYDERLLLVIGAAGLVLLVLFALTPVLRPYYALLMPATIAIGASLAWILLRNGRLASSAGQDTGSATAQPGKGTDALGSP